MNDVFEIAKSIQFNAKAEAEAVGNYTDLLQLVNESEIGDSEKIQIKNIISEIIKNNLDHSSRLQKLYVKIMGLDL